MSLDDWTQDYFTEAVRRGMARRAAQRAAQDAAFLAELAAQKPGPVVCIACGSADVYSTTSNGDCERVTCRVCLATFSFDSVPQEARGLGDEVLA